MAELTLRADASEAEIDDLWERLKAFSDADRRETLSAWGKQVSVVSKASSSTVSSAGSGASTVSVSASTAGADVSHTSTVATSPVQNTYYTVDTTPRKIKPFSGASKVGGGEVDHAHWRRAANRIIEDGEIFEGRKRNILLQSLSGVAEDAIDMYRDRSCQTIVEILDQIFGSTSDGHDLLADFYQIIQLPNQTTSEYLTQLYTRLCEVVKQEGILMREVPETLTRQFLRGTTDEEMLMKLRLEVDQPLDFPAFIAKVRREEARRTERRLRLHKVVRSNVSTASHSPTQSTTVTSPRVTTSPDNDIDEVAQLRKRITMLEASNAEVNLLAQKVQDLQTKVKSGVFCYRCGQDGHVAYDCDNPPNKSLVEEKYATRRGRRRPMTGNLDSPRQEATARGKR